uniref:Putative secreted peptide n=1 Tax=Anopheles braziliensis TaxID=58242 RepID=A0A2M3ZTD9_9DIPT
MRLLPWLCLPVLLPPLLHPFLVTTSVCDRYLFAIFMSCCYVREANLYNITGAAASTTPTSRTKKPPSAHSLILGRNRTPPRHLHLGMLVVLAGWFEVFLLFIAPNCLLQSGRPLTVHHHVWVHMMAI